MEDLLLKIRKNLAPELGEDLAQELARSIACYHDGSLRSLEHIFFEVGVQWSAVLLAWRDWISEKAQYRPVLLMRDAEPLTVIPRSSQWQVAWLNRKNCGIEDELSGDRGATINPFIKDYLEQENLLEPFTFVDGGAWGTIVLELYGIGLRFQPLFFYSHNPNIPGFLNELGISREDGELLNDSLECSFLKSIRRPSRFCQDASGKIRPELLRTDPVIASLSRATLRGVEAGAANLRQVPDPHRAIECLLALSRKAANSGKFSGILPRNSPTWSKGESFLASWPKRLKWT